MAIKRPKNINKRLTGTPSCTPGNAGQIGPVKTPYCVIYPVLPVLGGRYYGGAGCCGGIFRLAESYCGITELCNITPVDLGGNLICKSASIYWIVSPGSAEVGSNGNTTNNANICAQSVTGCTGWFVPTCGQLQDPGYTCRTYWDSYTSGLYWTSEAQGPFYGFLVNFTDGTSCGRDRTFTHCARSFRCVSY